VICAFAVLLAYHHGLQGHNCYWPPLLATEMGASTLEGEIHPVETIQSQMVEFATNLARDLRGRSKNRLGINYWSRSRRPS
jgi:hypothetical protein